MNKHFFLSVITLFITCSFVCANDEAFTQHLKNCSKYSSSGNVQVEGMDVTSKRNITGWQNGKCAYQEQINMMGIDSVVSCKFTKVQINELTSVMEAYALTQKYSGESPDFSKLDQAEKNPVARVWNRYLTDDSVCTIKTPNMDE